MKKITNFIETFYFLFYVKTKNKFLFFWILFKIKKKFNNLINYSASKKIKLKIINFYEDIVFFYGNFFISHALTIYNLINKLKKIDNQKYLEIGSFEGSSAIFFSRFLTNSNLTCVDIWKGVEELSNIDFKVVESNFDKNISKIKFNKIIKIKSESEVFFKNNKEKFSIIYLDGNHFFQNVINDIEQSWRILEVDGLLILDDYMWTYYNEPKQNPAYAINIFLNKYYKSLKILDMGQQVVVKKLYE
jgi:predicted O-methyltransferase YrrM